jgi:putative phosphoribosyl transferase
MFKNREDAGEQLAKKLKKFKGKKAVVYALPRGGIELGIIISRQLKLPLDLIIARKIGHPNNPEYAIAAVCENSVLVTEKGEVEKVDRKWFYTQVERERNEAKRRRNLYLGEKKSIPAKNKTAVIVDDGVATGLTLRAAIEEIKLQKPEKIIVAVPVMPKETYAQLLEAGVDEIICLEIPVFFAGAVGSYYKNFPQVTDEEVIGVLE